ncbi:MAG: helix-turn-helix domain-containing protein [Planctomycetes bacterium]|nr:helix-turn-helix domain-containing protein [Planctomycetota bacterium]
MTANEVAELLGVSTSRIYMAHFHKRVEVPKAKHGNSYIYSAVDVERLREYFRAIANRYRPLTIINEKEGEA